MPEDLQVGTRVALLEADSKYMHEGMDRNTKEHEEIKTAISQVKEKVDKQNGLLPHLKEALDNQGQNFKDLQTELIGVRERVVQVDFKSRITWALISALATGLLAMVLQFVLK